MRDSDSTQTTEDIFSIHLVPATEAEADLELSLTVVSPNAQQDFVVEGRLKEGVLNNVDIETLLCSISCTLKSWEKVCDL